MYDLTNINLKKEWENLRSLEGKERGSDIKFLRNYARIKKGNEGVRAVKNELAKAGVDLPDINKLRDLEWASIALPTIYMLAMTKVFGWGEEDIIQMGREALSLNAPMKFFLKYFSSPARTFKKAAEKWQSRYYQQGGRLEIVEVDEKGKKVTFRVIDFKKHPITCIYHRGVFSKIVELATGSDKTSAQEAKCMFRGDPYHEYTISWE